MSEPQEQFELVEFEQVEAAPGMALLRVSGHPAPDLAAGPLALLIDDGRDEHRHAQLPALPGSAGIARAAFAVPLEQLEQGATYALELPGGALLRVPAPLPGPAAPASEAAATPAVSGPPAEEPVGESARVHAAERRAESGRLAIAELELRLQSESERRAAAEERAHAAAANVGALEAQIRAAADAAARAHAALEAQLGDRAAELERMRAAAEVAQARAHASRREATALGEQLAHAQAQVALLRQALEEELGALRDAATRSEAEHSYELETAAARLDAAHAEAGFARAEADAVHHHNAELEATLAGLDAVLVRRAAEVALLREAAETALAARTSELESAGEAVQAEAAKRIRAEEALVEVSAQHALRAESLALGAAGHGA